uniref:Uncharacterized protein n=1 Tax=Cajanus cajan TaxID=3821 RepID=A0A151S610_CAJCA|nr:hypothetical protein KK1_028007 [Cajanus cajan]KYP50232.1 hypothetical protein KK1_028038 [Cajanus cajan]
MFYQIPWERVSIFAFHVKGEALSWFKWMFNNNQLGDWTSFSRDLQLYFGPSSYENHQAELFKLKHVGIVSEYQFAFEKLSNQVCGLAPTTFMNSFISRLILEIKNELAILRPQFVSQAIGLAKLPNVPISFHQTSFPVPLYILSIKGADVVSGLTWLRLLGPIKADFSIPSITFNHQQKPITLTGVPFHTPSPLLTIHPILPFLPMRPNLHHHFFLPNNHTLAKGFYGPFQVYRRIGLVAYDLDLPSSSRIHSIVHIAKLRPYHGSNPLEHYNPLPSLSFDNEEDHSLFKADHNVFPSSNLSTPSTLNPTASIFPTDPPTNFFNVVPSMSSTNKIHVHPPLHASLLDLVPRNTNSSTSSIPSLIPATTTSTYPQLPRHDLEDKVPFERVNNDREPNSPSINRPKRIISKPCWMRDYV